MKLSILTLPLIVATTALAAPLSTPQDSTSLHPRGWSDRLTDSIFGSNPQQTPWEALHGGSSSNSDDYMHECRQKKAEQERQEEQRRRQEELNRSSKERLPKEWSAGTDHVRKMYEEKKWKKNGLDLVKNPLDD